MRNDGANAVDVIFEVSFAYDVDKDELSLTRIMGDGTQNTSPVDIAVTREMEKACRDLAWNRSPQVMIQVGAQLYELLNGDGQWLSRALQEANARGACLRLYFRLAGPTVNLPFEVLWREDFLVPARGVHVVRLVSDRGCKANPLPRDRPLRMLFMACSPEGLGPVLDFEKEEEVIGDVTNDLAIDLDVEDTGSLEGLVEQLANNEYDAIHLSGHGDIDDKGVPFFWMEDEKGLPVRVAPAQLCEALSMSQPRLVFLSGCRTGETASQTAAVSFAQHLVAGGSSTALGWGLSVSDREASAAAQRLYFDLTRGESILSATSATRQELFKRGQRDWSLLRLFSDGTPLCIPLVQKGQKREEKIRDLQYTYLLGSQVKVLRQGFVGRRRQIQRGLRCLRTDNDKVGLLLHGTGGLGKSCLAGKLCDRLNDYTLIIVHARLTDMTLRTAMKDAFFRANDQQGLQILDEKREMPERIQMLCSSCFRHRNYMILLDDFEQNLQNVETSGPRLRAEAVPIVESLLRYLPNCGKMTKLIITTRYRFGLRVADEDLIEKSLESIGLTSFRGADMWKKVGELKHIAKYHDTNIKRQLITAGRGNPRLMEAIDTLVAEVEGLTVTGLLNAVKDEQDEFVQELILKHIFNSQSEEFQKFVRRASVYRRPVLSHGINLVCADERDWKDHLERGVTLSLIERDNRSDDCILYWVTPLLRDEAFAALQYDDRIVCHSAAVQYYGDVQSKAGDYSAIAAMELIGHALRAGLEEVAIAEAGPLVGYLRTTLAYSEARAIAEMVLSHANAYRTTEYSNLLFQTGSLFRNIGESKKAVSYCEQALAIDKAVHGDRHLRVAAHLNSLAEAWRDLGDAKRAIGYYEQALTISKAAYGGKHPEHVALLNNLGQAWRDLGDAKRAIGYYEQALTISRAAYGGKHPDVASIFNNLAIAWSDLGELKKAIDYHEQALAIDKAAYGGTYPSVARDLNNLGVAWSHRGDAKKAIGYCEQALAIDKAVYGDTHPSIAKNFSNLGVTWYHLGKPKKAIGYYEQALTVTRAVYGDGHPNLSPVLSNIGTAWRDLGDPKKAIGYYEQALAIDKAVYGDEHPEVGTLLNSLGQVWRDLGDAKRAIVYYEQALTTDKAVYGDKHPEVSRLLNSLGQVWYDLGDSKKAIGYHEQALTVTRAVYGDGHPNLSPVLSNIGTAWRDLGDPKKAIAYYEQALTIDKGVYGDTHPRMANDFNNLGVAWSDMGDAKKAIGYYERALAIDKAVYGNKHPNVARDLSNIGAAWRELAEPKKAIGYYEQALAIDKVVYRDTHPSVAIRLNNIALDLHDQGESKKAIRYSEQAIAISRAVYGDKHPSVASMLSNLGLAWHTLGEQKKAAGCFEEAYAILLRVYGSEHPRTKTAKQTLDFLRGVP